MTQTQSEPRQHEQASLDAAEELRRETAAFRNRVRTVRISVAVLVLFSTVIAALLFTYDTDLPHPLDLVHAVSPQGQHIVLQHKRNALSESASFVLGRRVEEHGTQWSQASLGRPLGIEFQDNGDIALLFGHQALVYRNTHATSASEWPGKLERFTYAGVPTSDLAATATSDGVAVAWYASGNLGARFAGDATSIQENAVLDGISGRATRFALISTGDRLHAILFIPYGDTSKAPLLGQLKVVSFSLKHTEPEQTDAGHTKAEAAADRPGASSSEPATDVTPSVSKSPSSTHTKYIAPTDLKIEHLDGEVQYFTVLRAQDRLLLVYRKFNDETWYGRLGGDGIWGAPFAMKDLDPDGVLREKCNLSLQPDLSVFNGRLYHAHLPKGEGSLRIRSAEIAESGLSAWQEHEAWPLFEVSPIPIQRSMLWALLLLMSTGAVLCIVWLGLNREQDVEQALNRIVRTRTGRDTGLLKKPVRSDKVTTSLWAGAIRRGLALLIDVAIMTPIVAGIGAATGYDIEHLLNLYPFHQQFPLEGLTERLVTLSVVALYGFICEAWFGRTLGKVVLNMRVVTAGGHRPGVFAIFSRNLLRIFELCHPSTILICVLVMFFTRRHQRVGDLLSGTAVKIDVPDDDDDTTAREPGA